MNLKTLSKGVAAAMAVAAAAPAFSQGRPDVLVKQRQAAMILQGKYFYPLERMAQGKTPYNGEQVTRDAVLLDALVQMAWDGFAPSTQNEKTRALPTVFSDTGKFKELSERLQSETHKLVTVSKGKDEAATKAQIGAVSKACSACHDDFRQNR